MSDKLLPCPFCGGEAKIISHGKPYRKVLGGQTYRTTVGCSICTANVSQAAFSKDKSCEEAAAAWNRRTNPPPLPLTVEQLKALNAEPLKHWVWIEILDTSAFSAYYRTYADYTDGKEFCCGWPGVGYSWDYCDYGKTWIAYDRKPEEGSQ